MSNYSSDADLASRRTTRSRQLTLAGVLLMLSGAVHVVQGVIALVDQTFATAEGQAVYDFDPTVWGWAQLIGGIVMLMAGVAVMRRAPWARPVAVVVAGISMFSAFIWFPFHVFGTMVILAVDGLVIGAVTAPGAFERDDD